MSESRTSLGGCVQRMLRHPRTSTFLAVTGLSVPTLYLCVWIAELREKYQCLIS